jgi:CMP-N,N'-diacetyllegionaminic acid synthase
MSILAVIPARGGSKGIPSKNIANLNGQPLIHYTIREALMIEGFQRVFISTDSPEIAEVCSSLGLEIPFLRPKSLGGDHIRTIDVVLDLLDRLEKDHNESFDQVCLLQPTSPLRLAQDILACVDIMEAENPDSVVSLTQIDEPHPGKMKKVVNGIIQPFMDGANSSIPRQELPEVFELNGAIYITKTQVLRDQHSFFGEMSIPYLMPMERSVNINHPLDMKLASLLMGEDDA